MLTASVIGTVSVMAILTNPIEPGYNISRGIAYAEKKNYDKAIYEFKKALEIKNGYKNKKIYEDHTYFEVHLYLARAYQQNGMSDEAIEEYKKALNVMLWYQAEDAFFIHKNLVKIYLEKKLYVEALEEYKALAGLDPIFIEDYNKLKSDIENESRTQKIYLRKY